MAKVRGVTGLLPTLRCVATMSDKLLRGLEGSPDGLLGNTRLDLGGVSEASDLKEADDAYSG